MTAIILTLSMIAMASTLFALPLNIDDLQAQSNEYINPVKLPFHVVKFAPNKNSIDKSETLDTAETIWGLGRYGNNYGGGGGWGTGNWGHYGSGNFGQFGNGGYGGYGGYGPGVGSFSGWGQNGVYGGLYGQNGWPPYGR